MGSTRDFLASSFADGLFPLLRRPMEDVVYETLDQRQVPNRTDFKELRDLVNSLRGQLTGATGGVNRMHDRIEEIEDRLDAIEAKLEALDAAPRAPAPPPAAAPAAASARCRVPHCNEPTRARGFCARHYQRWRRGTLDGFPNPG